MSNSSHYEHTNCN